ncbi:MAG: hypothetical protein WDW36_003872 [Sanguina aurantia]
MVATTGYITSHYSIAASPCGNFVAAGGDSGWLHLFGYFRGDVGSNTPAALMPIGCFRFRVKCSDMCSLHCNHRRRRSSMINCVRFGSCFGQMRLLITCQETAIFMFNIPPWSGVPSELPPFKDFVCKDLPKFSQSHLMDPPVLAVTDVVEHFTQTTEGFNQLFTFQGEHPCCHLSLLGKPFNAAEPSPDGRWMAIAMDAPMLLLLSCESSAPQQQPRLLTVPVPEGWVKSAEVAQACQYLRFNATSTILAASSDALKCVLLFDVASGILLSRYSLDRAALALAWAPWGDGRVLCYSSDKGSVYITHLDTRTAPCRIRIRQVVRAVGQTQEAGSSSDGEDGSDDEFEQQSDGEEAEDQEEGEGDMEEGGEGEEGVDEVWEDVNMQASGGSSGSEVEEMEDLELGAGAAPDVSAVGWEGGAAQSGGVLPGGGSASGVASDAAVGPTAEAAGQLAQQGASVPKPLLKLAGLNGIVLTRDGHLLVATKKCILSWSLMIESCWSLESHKFFPERFKAAVKLLLSGSSFPNPPSTTRGSGDGVGGSCDGGMGDRTSRAMAPPTPPTSSPSPGCAFTALPVDVLGIILSKAAFPLHAWADPAAELVVDVPPEVAAAPEAGGPAE